MNRYLIFYNDHVNNKKNVLLCSDSYNKYEALDKITEYSENYIKNIIGDSQIKYYNEKDTQRVFGYFIIKKMDDNNSLCVYRKYKEYGFLYNSVKIKKLITYSLLAIKDYNIMHDQLNFYEEFDNTENYKHVLDELTENEKFMKSFENFNK